ncbi:MAG: HNH endonuclease [Paludibacteraceae bacterium]|nr:HNH endonuclease [Paludibacteraceae bacterium]
MAILQSVRDKLLIYSAGKCAKCKRDLLIEGYKICSVGEVCHIISKKQTGPRHQSNLADYDCYDNLIFLCANCHKEIDTNIEEYTVERLKEIKSSHEKDVAEKLKNEQFTILHFLRVNSGIDLGNIFFGCHCYQISHEPLNEEGLKIIDELDDYIKDVLDIQDDISLNDKKEIYTHLQKHIKEFENLGYYTYVARTSVNSYSWKILKLHLLVVKSTSSSNLYAKIK